MTKRIFRSICFVALTVFLASLTLIMGVLYSYFTEIQKAQLKTQTLLAAQGVSHESTEYFEGLKADNYRITWINSDGSVLYDSRSDKSSMENHLEREEIKEALETGYGESTRYSATLMERSLYAAQKLDDGTVVRLSTAQSTVLLLLLGMIQPIAIIFVIAAVLSMVLASRLSKKIVRPLNSLNLDEPLSNEGYDELAPLLRRIDTHQKQFRQQSTELSHKKDEFDAVTKSMNEGLVLLNNKGVILSINRAAKKLLNTDSSCIGQDILSLNRTLEIHQLLKKALNGEECEKIVQIAEGEYQIDVNPVVSENHVSGAVLLMFDVTEKEDAEQLRREFTANVSHELKTPLHSISGYAELLKNGMVRNEDVTQFAGKVYSEAQRMIRLVEDIIRLSRLDEGAEDMKHESVDLYALAEETARNLAPEAEQANITINLKGRSAFTNGNSQLLSGIITNLCDNAIKYNRKGGSVTIEVTSDKNGACVTVSDTGIGIPPEHQSRIFERFYRVDKSHSKEVGGTGLGLSIVKHSAKIHNARIDLHSTVGKGTSISVHFPTKQ